MFLELHIIQNFAPSCLNRDDTGSPKECVFGGHRRARISSQCQKRAVREHFLEHRANLGLGRNLGTRTRYLGRELSAALEREGKDREKAKKISDFVIAESGMKARNGKTSVTLFLGEDEIVSLRDAILKNWSVLSEGLDKKDESKRSPTPERKKRRKRRISKQVEELLETLKAGTKAVDVALFGRMVAEMPQYGMNIDAATQVAHAISTNRAIMEMDFFAAVDDLERESSGGAGMLGFVEFNSSCFYRYALVDYQQLKTNLGGDTGLARAAAAAFAEAFITAVPSGRQTSTAARNPPDFIKGVLTVKGQPFSAANAFLEPAEPNGGRNLVEDSIDKFVRYCDSIESMFQGSRMIVDEMVSSRVKLKGISAIPVPELVVRIGEGLE